ncbi:MAG: hypothetical protein RIC29_08475 [Rhodospirillaceae bacterium]
MRFVIGAIAIIVIAVVAFYTVDLDVNDSGALPSIESSVEVDPGELPDYDVVKTKDGRAPTVSGDIDVEGGRIPDVDVDVVDVEVGSEDVKIEVPDVDVEMKEKTIEVPSVDVDLPEDQ